MCTSLKGELQSEGGGTTWPGDWELCRSPGRGLNLGPSTSLVAHGTRDRMVITCIHGGGALKTSF